jgi:hypothetical protein
VKTALGSERTALAMAAYGQRHTAYYGVLPTLIMYLPLQPSELDGWGNLGWGYL